MRFDNYNSFDGIKKNQIMIIIKLWKSNFCIYKLKGESDDERKKD